LPRARRRSHRRVVREEADGRLKRPATSITADLPALADEYGARWLVADYAAGDVVVHTAHTVHAALDNVDPGGVLRLSTDIRYQRISRSTYAGSTTGTIATASDPPPDQTGRAAFAATSPR
jgi:hypothetical protein